MWRLSLAKKDGDCPTGRRQRLRDYIRKVRRDDRMIREEGLETLTESELRTACRERGMAAPYGPFAKEFMTQQMKWVPMRRTGGHSFPALSLPPLLIPRPLLSPPDSRPCREWLELSLQHSIPTSLLILSRALTLAAPVTVTKEDRTFMVMRDVIGHLPDEAVEVSPAVRVGGPGQGDTGGCRGLVSLSALS